VDGGGGGMCRVDMYDVGIARDLGWP